MQLTDLQPALSHYLEILDFPLSFSSLLCLMSISMVSSLTPNTPSCFLLALDFSLLPPLQPPSVLYLQPFCACYLSLPTELL